MGVIFFVFFALIGLLWLFAMIAAPIYFILSGIGAFQTLRRYDFHYPIIGHFIASKINPAMESNKLNQEN